MDLCLQLGSQRHAVRLLQLFYLQHSRKDAVFPDHGVDDDRDEATAAKAAPKPPGGKPRGRKRKERSEEKKGGGGNLPPQAYPRAQAEDPPLSPEEEERLANDPFYSMVGDTRALDGQVRVFPGIWEDDAEEEEDRAKAQHPRRSRRLVFARAAVEMGPCANRHGPGAVYVSGVTVPPLVVVAWLKRSFVGRHVQRACFFPHPPQAAPTTTPSTTCAGTADTPQQAAAEAWALAARTPGLDGVRVACSDRKLQAEVLAALEEGEGAVAASAAKKGKDKGGGSGGSSPLPPPHLPRLRLEPTANVATHALCVARVSVEDLKAVRSPLLRPEDDGAAHPEMASRAESRNRELAARKGQVGAAELAEAAVLTAPHRYVWSLAPTAWFYRLAADEPAAASGGACASAVHKLDEALRVLGLVGDGGWGGAGAAGATPAVAGSMDGRAARADVSPEEQAAWAEYEARRLADEQSASGAQCAPLVLRRALDVGAAPGSWTALLAHKILAAEAAAGGGRGGDGAGGNGGENNNAPLIVAVDPADLAPSCLALGPIVRHLRVRAGTEEATEKIREALGGGGGGAAAGKADANEQQQQQQPASVPPPSPPLPQVELITCDANTHPKITLERLVLPLLPHLKPGGLLVMTLKLHGTGRRRGRSTALCNHLLGKAGMAPGAALWLLANTNQERTYVARKREDWVDE